MRIANYASWGQIWGKYSTERDKSAMQVHGIILKRWQHVKQMQFCDHAILIAGDILELKSHYSRADYTC